MSDMLRTEFKERVLQAINVCCQENASNTPDFVLAQYLLNCLDAFNDAIEQRGKWYAQDDSGDRLSLLEKNP